MAGKDTPERKNESIKLNVTDNDLKASIQKGVMEDRPNYKRLIFWSLLGFGIFVLFVYMLAGMYDYNNYVTEYETSATSKFYQIEQLEKKEQERLNSFGVINAEEGTYRIPIDSAISRYVQEVKK